MSENQLGNGEQLVWLGWFWPVQVGGPSRAAWAGGRGWTPAHLCLPTGLYVQLAGSPTPESSPRGTAQLTCVAR